MKVEPGRHAASALGGRVELEADVVIIGSGAGGSACAAALADAGLIVAVLEEGRHWKPADFRQDTAFSLRNLYQDRGARTTRGNAIIPLPGGRGVGGSTLINSAIAFKTPAPVLKQWREQYGCDRVTDERFAAYFDRIWRTIGVTVNPVAVQRNNNLVFKRGVEKLGLNGQWLARSAPGCVGCGICQYGCPSGGKFSVDRTFLAEAIAKGTVGVYADCRVTGVQTDGDRVTAVTGRVLDPETFATVGEVVAKAKVFVVAGGPIQSPLFLLKNGLASSEHCGQHLVIHPTCGLLARNPQVIEPWSGVTQGYYVDCWDQGFLLQTFTVTPDQYFLMLQRPVGAATMEWMADLSRVSSAGALVHDEDSVGFVRPTPLGSDIYYHFGDGDKRRLIDGMRLCAKVMLAAGATSVLAGHMGATPVARAEDVDGTLPYDLPAQQIFLYASHPMGTCRMGGDAATSVVDPAGRVWGWANLRVADASVFPTSLGVNPQVTTMAMGLMVGEAIADK